MEPPSSRKNGCSYRKKSNKNSRHWFLYQLLAQHINFQVFANPELYYSFGWNFNDGACLRIASQPGFAILYCENSQPLQFIFFVFF